VPARFDVLAGWPLDAHGRLDTAALPLPADLADPGETDEVPAEPRTESERVIAQIWAEVLGTERVGIYDDFFALGGHSLMGAEVIDRVREHFSLNLPLGQLFESPTVAAVAAFVESQREQAAPSTPIKRINRADYRRQPAGEDADR
jgi:acyl carrier protein